MEYLSLPDQWVLQSVFGKPWFLFLYRNKGTSQQHCTNLHVLKNWQLAFKTPWVFFVNGNNVLCCPPGSPEDGGKPFQCPVCGLVIKRKSYWKRHMVIHTGLKSHQCPLCPFRCARKDNLKSHMKVRWYGFSSSCDPASLITLTHIIFN